MRIRLTILACLTLCGLTFADTLRVRLDQVEGSFLMAVQSRHTLFSGKGAWTPLYFFSDHHVLRGDFGVSMLQRNDDTLFVAPDAALLYSFRGLGDLYLEAGPGLEWWVAESRINPTFTARIAEALNTPYFTWLDRCFVEYSSVFASGNVVHQVKIGAGASF